jgi:hypothetical protein
MNIRERLAKAINEEIHKGIDPDSIAVMAHRVTYDLVTANMEIHKKAAIRGRKLTEIQALIHKKPFEQRTAIEQRVLDIIFENV